MSRERDAQPVAHAGRFSAGQRPVLRRAAQLRSLGMSFQHRGLELTRFSGHLILWLQGVHDA